MAAKKPESPIPTSPLQLIIFALLFAAIVPIVASFFSFGLNPLEFLLEVRDFFAPFFKQNLWWLKLLSVFLSALFLWGIIYIIIKTKYLSVKKEQFLDILGKGHVSRSRSLKAWKQIMERMKSEEQNQWKLAILESDHILNEILKMSGYLGSRLDDKLDLITPVQLANIDSVRNAHLMRDKIAKDPTFEITKEEADEVIKIYEQAFKELNLIQE